MKTYWNTKLSFWLTLWVCVFFAWASQSSAQTNVSGTITTNTTWDLAGSPYIMTSVTVNSGVTLTIDPGVVVKTDNSISISNGLTVNGTLIADGTLADPITFTSFLDDTVGGDSNGDGNATSPERGDWDDIRFGSSSVNSVLDHVMIRYGGGFVNGSLEIFSSSVTVTNSMIEECAREGIFIGSGSSPTITDSTIQNNDDEGVYIEDGSPVLTGNTITNNLDGLFLREGSPVLTGNTITNNSFNGVDLDLFVGSDIPGTPTFTGNTISNNGNGGIVARDGILATISGNTIQDNSSQPIALVGNSIYSSISGNTLSGNLRDVISLSGTVTDSGALSANTEVYSLIFSLTIDTGATLTINPGTVFKTDDGISISNGLTVNGTLIANGTLADPIVFTSFLDDTVGGDSNGDGNATSPARGDWDDIRFGSSSVNSVLDHVVIRYGGGFVNGSLEIFSSSVTVTNSTVEECAREGIFIGSGSSPTITDSTIQNNDDEGVYIEDGSPVLTGNTITNNLDGLFLREGSPALTGNTITNNSFNGVDLDLFIGSDCSPSSKSVPFCMKI